MVIFFFFFHNQNNFSALVWNMRNDADMIVAVFKLFVGPAPKFEFGDGSTSQEVVINHQVQTGDIVHVSITCQNGTYEVYQVNETNLS